MAFGGGFFSCLPAFSKLFTMSIYYIYNLKNTEQCKENKEFIYNALVLLPLSQLDTEIHSPLGFYTPVFKSPEGQWAPNRGQGEKGQWGRKFLEPSLSFKHWGTRKGSVSPCPDPFPRQVYGGSGVAPGGLCASAQPPCKSAHPSPPKGPAHILKSLLQSQADAGLDAGPLLPLPPEHFTEGGVRAGGAHGGV